MRYSLLCPTRHRVHAIRRLLESLVFTTNCKQDFEILFAIDTDDKETKDFFDLSLSTNQYSDLNIRPLYRERSEFLNRDYYNWMASQAKGDFYWAIGDDVVFQVINWDIHIINHLNKYLENKPDKIVCAGIKDNTPKPKPTLPQFPCFPLISKEAFKTLGFLLHPNIPTWGADYLIYLLYTQANRYLVIDDDCYLLHIGIHTKTGPKDETAQSVENIFNRLKMHQDHNIDRHAEQMIPIEVEELRRKIVNLGGSL